MRPIPAAPISGPTSKALGDRVKEDVDKLKAENPSMPVPADLVTTSGSGLDPDISPEGALFQVPRVAKARNMPEDQVRQLVADKTEGRLAGSWVSPASTFWRSIWRWTRRQEMMQELACPGRVQRAASRGPTTRLGAHQQRIAARATC